MKTIVITSPIPVKDEASIIECLVSEGISRVHLRRPSLSETGMRRLIESLPSSCYSYLSLHDHYHLAQEYGLGGIHLNGRNRCPQPMVEYGILSCSCHSIAELNQRQGYSYKFLSPVFDSISKAGYNRAFSREELSVAAHCGIIGDDTIALGGVTPALLPLVVEMGFGGAAFMGAIWQSSGSPEEFVKSLKRYRNG